MTRIVPHLYRLSEAPDHSELGVRFATQIEEQFRDVRNELGLPSAPTRDRPPTTPPPSS